MKKLSIETMGMKISITKVSVELMLVAEYKNQGTNLDSVKISSQL